MNEAITMEIAHEAVWIMLQLSGLPMLVGMIVGLVIALFQALTQLNESTLTFVPKLIIICVTVLLLFPFMIHTLSNFMEELMDRAISLS